LLDRRHRTAAGLIELCHPWESGCDDSPRWDDLCPAGWSTPRWYDMKGTLLDTIQRSSEGSPVANPAFAVGSVGFTALVAFNAIELATVTDNERLRADSVTLAEALAGRWDSELVTWVDDGPTAGGSGRLRTIDALLPLLLAPHLPPEQVRQATRALTNPAAHGAPFGPTGVHRAEPTFAASTYWRGSSWPQLTYLLALATSRAGESDETASLTSSLRAGAISSGWAEHWDPDSGVGLGAAPQSWTTLAAVEIAAQRAAT
jgi:glycogen debranching enzyme